MTRPVSKSFVEITLIVAALLTGALLTRFVPAPSPEGDAAAVHRATRHAAACDITGIDVDMRRLRLVASIG